MNVISIVLLVALGGLVLWLAIDTTIFCVKKVKQRKKEKQDKESQNTSN